MRGGRGFTLIEVLVTFGIIVALAVMLLPALNGARFKGERIAATANMRQIGTAIRLCANDRDGLLPGPLQIGQKSSYSTNSKQLANVLMPYLDVGDPAPNQTIKVFFSPAFARAIKGKNPKDVHPFLINISPTVDGVTITPFGSDAPKKESQPMKLAAIGANVWALCDADQQNPRAKGHPWEPNTPAKIIHGHDRLALNLDGSVRNISSTELEIDVPPPPPPKPPPPPAP